MALLDDGLWAVNARFGTDATPETEYWISRVDAVPGVTTSCSLSGPDRTIEFPVGLPSRRYTHRFARRPAPAAPWKESASPCPTPARAWPPSPAPWPSSLSLVAAPAVLAQDGPEATIEGLLAAIEAKDFEAHAGLLLRRVRRPGERARLRAMTEGMPDSPEVQSLFDAIILDVEIASLEVLSQSDTEAIVELVASMTMDVDAEAMGPFVGVMLEMSGMPITDENVEMFTGLMLAEFEAESTDISEEITLVPGETMPWVICDELGADEIDETEGMVDEGMVDEGMDDEMSEDADGE